MSLPAVAKSLSARLLVLTIVFVMLAEVLIYTPSIARFRMVWLEEKLAAGHLAALTTMAAPEGMVTPELEAQLLDHVGAYRIYLTKPGKDLYSLGSLPPRAVTNVIDLEGPGAATMIVEAFGTMLNGAGRISRVRGTSPREPEAMVEVIFDETPLRAAMLDFSVRILALSIIISLITAGLVFLALHWLTVLPLKRFTERLVGFRETPEDAEAIIVPSGRSDEVGVAERELHDMQVTVRQALKQKDRLAALGTAVTKINHDLRNILSTVSILSERLSASGDPQVRDIAPRLMEAIDRAVDLCSRTLAFTREGDQPLHRSRVDLRSLVDSAAADLAPVINSEGTWDNRVPEGLVLLADGDQLQRVLVNLGKNAFQAGARTVTVAAESGDGGIALLVADDGPGLPAKVREHLFKPFTTAQKGGTGLGLAIAREIVAAHRGDIRLDRADEGGTVFRIELPTGWPLAKQAA
jgi:signal transduction histidine kinase